MERILIIGASKLQAPAIVKAKQMGYYVATVDINPEAVGISYADEFFNVSTNDIDGIIEVAKKFKPNGVMTLATDMPVRSVAKVAEIFNLTGISMDTAIKTTDKGKMIRAFSNYGVAHPWYYIVSDLDDLSNISNDLKYPCIIKPTDSSGSRGVSIVHSFSELKNSYKYALYNSGNGNCIVEEYLSGPEVSVEIMVINGYVHVLQITDKITTGEPHFVELGHNQPSKLDRTDLNKIIKLAKKAVKSVGIDNGPAHVEIILTKDGPKMVELGARMGGDCIGSHLVLLSTGIDMVKLSIEIACGKRPQINKKLNKGSSIKFFKTREGVIKNIKGLNEAKMIKGVKEIYFFKDIGERISRLDSSGDRLGYIIAQGENSLEAEQSCIEAISKIEIEIE